MARTCPSCAENIQDAAKKCPHCGEWLDVSAANENTLKCPFCSAASGAAADRQACGSCRRPFYLFAGPRLDNSRDPPGDGGRTYKSKSSGLLLGQQATLSDAGFEFGDLDPVAGLVSINSKMIMFGDVGSIAAWARFDWVMLLLGVFLMLPMSLGLVAAVVSEPRMLILAGPIWALTGFVFWRAVGVGARYMRVCSADQTFKFRYDAPFYRHRGFLSEAVRRSGIAVPASLK